MLLSDRIGSLDRQRLWVWKYEILKGIGYVIIFPFPTVQVLTCILQQRKKERLKKIEFLSKYDRNQPES